MRIIADEHQVLARCLMAFDETGRLVRPVEIDTETMEAIQPAGRGVFMPFRVAKLAFRHDLTDDSLAQIHAAYPAIACIERAPAPQDEEAFDLGWGF